MALDIASYSRPDLQNVTIPEVPEEINPTLSQIFEIDLSNPKKLRMALEKAEIAKLTEKRDIEKGNKVKEGKDGKEKDQPKQSKISKFLAAFSGGGKKDDDKPTNEQVIGDMESDDSKLGQIVVAPS